MLGSLRANGGSRCCDHSLAGLALLAYPPAGSKSSIRTFASATPVVPTRSSNSETLLSACGLNVASARATIFGQHHFDAGLFRASAKVCTRSGSQTFWQLKWRCLSRACVTRVGCPEDILKRRLFVNLERAWYPAQQSTHTSTSVRALGRAERFITSREYHPETSHTNRAQELPSEPGPGAVVMRRLNLAFVGRWDPLPSDQDFRRRRIDKSGGSFRVLFCPDVDERHIWKCGDSCVGRRVRRK